MRQLRTVELFCGIGGFRLAADSNGLKTVWANDLEPRACAVYRSHFGNVELREGDIRDLLGEVPSHELLTAGFPCQPFSSAGKKRGVRDPRGTLFQPIVTVLEHHRPRFFILENVKRLLAMERGLHFATILSVLSELDYLIEWRLLNAMHFALPQNRQRVVLLGTLKPTLSSDGRHPVQGFSIKLATNEDLTGLSAVQLRSLGEPGAWKAIVDHGARFPSWGLARQGSFFGADLETFSEGSSPVPVRSILQADVSPAFDFTDSTLVRMKTSKPVHRFVDGVEILNNQAGGARMGYTVFGINGVAPTLTATQSRHYERYRIEDRYRRLTNVEYARIQGFPDDYCGVIRNYDQYALFGNAVPPPMVAWVMRRMSIERAASVTSKDPQMDLFAAAHR
jgi:DNA (cytosine-5)-methyltransferase 1